LNRDGDGTNFDSIMATHPFRIVNVFTQDRGALTGNPLCVFELGRGTIDIH
jgi:hypothetical protein